MLILTMFVKYLTHSPSFIFFLSLLFAGSLHFGVLWGPGLGLTPLSCLNLFYSPSSLLACVGVFDSGGRSWWLSLQIHSTLVDPRHTAPLCSPAFLAVRWPCGGHLSSGLRADMLPFSDLTHRSLLQELLSELSSLRLSNIGAALGQAPGMISPPSPLEFLASPSEKLLMTKATEFWWSVYNI